MSTRSPDIPAWRNLLRRSLADKLLLFEAVVRLTLLRALIAVIGKARQPRLYGARAKSTAAGQMANAAIVLSPEERRLARRIGWAVTRAERALPFDVVCLPQALVARRMLKRRGIPSVMFFGVETGKPIEEVGTHAWLVSGDVPITGFPQVRRYAAFASYLRAVGGRSTRTGQQQLSR